MALCNEDAIMLCNNLGTHFGKQFAQLYREWHNKSKCNKNEWRIRRMQMWFSTVLQIRLKNHQPLSNCQIVAWFLSPGQEIARNHHFTDVYDRFVEQLLSTRDLRGSMQQCIK